MEDLKVTTGRDVVKKLVEWGYVIANSLGMRDGYYDESKVGILIPDQGLPARTEKTTVDIPPRGLYLGELEFLSKPKKSLRLNIFGRENQEKGATLSERLEREYDVPCSVRIDSEEPRYERFLNDFEL